MIRLCVVSLALAFAGPALAADLKSGPQTGSKIPGPFAPLNVTGEDAGQKRCLVCKNGDNPVAMVFAKSPDDPQTRKLIKALDEATARHRTSNMGSFAIFCTDDDAQETKLKQWADREKVETLIVGIDVPAGPHSYKLAPGADVTVILYNRREVKANHAFGKGQLTDAAIATVVADVAKIVPGQ